MRFRFRKFLLLAILILIIGVFFLPVKIPFSFRATGIVYPVKKWSLKTDFNGNYEGELKNYKTGVLEDVTSYKFDRGDIARLSLLPYFVNNSYVKAGDTLGYISSRFMDEKIQARQHLADVESKLLESSLTGEKESILENLRQKLIYAEQQFDLTKKSYDRSLVLFQDSVIPPNEFEIAQTTFENARTAVNIAKSEYEVAKTGEKPEEIKLIEERISSYKKEIEFYDNMKNDYVLLSPFSGKMIFDLYALEPVEYISISDTSGYMLYAPIKFNYRVYLNLHSKIEFTVPGTETILNSHLLEISNKVDYINNSQVVFTMSEIENPSEIIFPGLTVQCRFVCDEVSPWEYAKRTLNIFMR
jgi:hypothetical protein